MRTWHESEVEIGVSDIRAHQMCLESDWQYSQTFHSIEQRRWGDFWFQPVEIGEEAIMGKWLTRTPNTDMMER